MITQKERIPWRPLLSGPAAEEARQAVMEIAEAIRRSPGIGETTPDIARGAAGISLFFTYLDRCGLDNDAATTAARFVETSRKLIKGTPSTLSLYYGLTGLGSAAAYLAPGGEDSPCETLCRTIDVLVTRTLEGDSGHDRFDLLSGLIGIGVYLALRSPAVDPRDQLDRIFELMERLGETHPAGATWRVPEQDLTPDVRALHPQSYFDLGLAHGGPGVVAFLSHCVHLGVQPARARELAVGTLRWLRTQELSVSVPPRFANLYSPGNPAREFARVAWCHGDPSVAFAMLTAGRLLAIPEAEEAATLLAIDASRCAPSADGIADTGLCHGTSGVAHVLNRMAQLTGDRELENGARRWFERTMSMRMPGSALAGFPMKYGPADSMAWAEEPGFLFGAAGVGLALAAAISATPPDWDRVLLLSWPEALQSSEEVATD